MRTCRPLFAMIVWLWAVPAFGGGFVLVSFASPGSGAVVPPGHLIEWTITASVSSADNMGLALISVDLVQNPANPALFDLPPAVRPADMQDFDRPRGLCNPGSEGYSSGYGGTPVGEAGARNLSQIGGAQNTFGVAGTGLGEDAQVDAGIGQGPGGQIIATGSFTAPRTPGVYTFALQSTLANTLRTVHTPPASSPVEPAVVVMDGAILTFTVCRPCDIDGDGRISLNKDISAFVSLLLHPDLRDDYAACAADMNDDGLLNGADIQPFVEAILLLSDGVDWDPKTDDEPPLAWVGPSSPNLRQPPVSYGLKPSESAPELFLE